MATYKHRTEVTPAIVQFFGGPHDKAFGPTGVALYSVPTDTRDARYVECTDHHVACDCREADLHEDLREQSMMLQLYEDTFVHLLNGHRAMTCECTGCRLARHLGLAHKIPGPDDEVPF